MTWAIAAGIWVSADNNTWYKLTDDNRQPIQSAPVRIEQVQRMANGTMRKYVIANKNVIDASWSYIPVASGTLYTGGGNLSGFKATTDGGQGAGFMKAFYDKYVFQPVYLRLVNATDNASATAFNSSQTGTLTNPIQIVTVTPNQSLGTPSTGSATFTTTTSHGLSVGQVVDIAGIFPVEYNGSYIVNAVDATRFAVSNISTASASGTYKTVTPRSGTELYQVFMTDFKYTTTKRFTLTDYVDVTMQFTEI